MEDTRERMARAIEHAKNEFATVRTGRASSSLIENLLVDYYGTETPLKQPGELLGARAALLVVSPFDKGAMAAIEKAIGNADLGLNALERRQRHSPHLPVTHRRASQVLRQDRRSQGRGGRVSRCAGCRHHARQELENLEKDKGLSSDEIERLEKILDKMTQDEVAVVDALLAHKEQELLEV
jgi:ribosome recycling factor